MGALSWFWYALAAQVVIFAYIVQWPNYWFEIVSLGLFLLAIWLVALAADYEKHQAVLRGASAIIRSETDVLKDVP